MDLVAEMLTDQGVDEGEAMAAGDVVNTAARLQAAAPLNGVLVGEQAHRATAQAMWDTCEAHTDSSRENFFLPWHRLYVLQFEDIIRKISGEPKFTLPYWNYTDAGSRALPIQFRQKNDATWKSLYRGSRNPEANAGTPIDKVPHALPINLDPMKSPLYQETDVDAGFCANPAASAVWLHHPPSALAS